MKREEIEIGMHVYHVTNEKIDMIVTYVGNPGNSNPDNQSCVNCEWITPEGLFMEKTLRPICLNKLLRL